MGDRLSIDEIQRLVKIFGENPSDFALLLIALNSTIGNWSFAQCMEFKNTGDWGLLGGTIGVIEDAFDVQADDANEDTDVDNGQNEEG